MHDIAAVRVTHNLINVRIELKITPPQSPLRPLQRLIEPLFCRRKGANQTSIFFSKFIQDLLHLIFGASKPLPAV